ncbi:MAG: ABC transporter ATP-binding protein [Candidatus Methanomethylophilus sp.]|nr:ABC transporter ATP-binding protein [Methanomethylophilus sp.]MDD3233290.1 ABC transporter ATP-binding protein [Methanomethylophilus sp.]MDD4221890.1 ABC transporter ATP-binding protein [Methanomethylophilus sp.]
MDGQLAIDVAGLTKTYGTFTAVDNLDLKVKKGEFMGLLGPNGAGKSTTLKSVSGLIRPTSGQILINGIDSQKNHRKALARVGCVIETPEFYRGYTPAELMEYAGRIYGLNKTETAIRARDVLEEVKMWEWRNKPIGEFSKGMRQRVALAQALLPNPEVIILDEPTSGLDPRGMIEIRQTLNSLKKRDRSLLISTHILKEVSEMCGTVTMINHGKVVTTGDVASLIHQSAMTDAGSVEIELRTLKDMTPAFITDLGGCAGVKNTEKMGSREVKVVFSGTDEDQASLVDVVYRYDLRLLGMTEKGADIEKLYMNLTKGEKASVQ